jgi:hypothetical protein
MSISVDSSKTLYVGDTVSVDLGSVRGEVVSTNIAKDRVGVHFQAGSFTGQYGGPLVIYFNLADLDWVKVPKPLINPDVDHVLDSTGRFFVRYSDGWYRESSLTGGFTITESELVNEHGPVTPLHKGEPVKAQGDEPDRGSDGLSKARHQTPSFNIEEANETLRQDRKRAEALEKAGKQALEDVDAEVLRRTPLISIEERNAIEQKQQWLNEC